MLFVITIPVSLGLSWKFLLSTPNSAKKPSIFGDVPTNLCSKQIFSSFNLSKQSKYNILHFMPHAISSFFIITSNDENDLT
jgi:hypothetical protein